MEETAAASSVRLSPAVFAAILDDVPDAWLLPEPGIPTAPAKRAAYADFLNRRLSAASNFVQEAIRARAELV